jgi:hypothetical protein
MKYYIEQITNLIVTPEVTFDGETIINVVSSKNVINQDFTYQKPIDDENYKYVKLEIDDYLNNNEITKIDHFDDSIDEDLSDFDSMDDETFINQDLKYKFIYPIDYGGVKVSQPINQSFYSYKEITKTEYEKYSKIIEQYNDLIQ